MLPLEGSRLPFPVLAPRPGADRPAIIPGPPIGQQNMVPTSALLSWHQSLAICIPVVQGQPSNLLPNSERLPEPLLPLPVAFSGLEFPFSRCPIFTAPPSWQQHLECPCSFIKYRSVGLNVDTKPTSWEGKGCGPFFLLADQVHGLTGSSLLTGRRLEKPSPDLKSRGPSWPPGGPCSP